MHKCYPIFVNSLPAALHVHFGSVLYCASAANLDCVASSPPLFASSFAQFEFGRTCAPLVPSGLQCIPAFPLSPSASPLYWPRGVSVRSMLRCLVLQTLASSCSPFFNLLLTCSNYPTFIINCSALNASHISITLCLCLYNHQNRWKQQYTYYKSTANSASHLSNTQMQFEGPMSVQ